MVFELQLWFRGRTKTLKFKSFLLLTGAWIASVSNPLWAADESGTQVLEDAAQLYQSGSYFKAARYAFSAMEQKPSLKPSAYAWIAMSLLKSGMPNASSYFFVRTLQSGNQKAIRSVLTQTEGLLMRVGADVLRKYLIRHTRYEDYDSANRSAYLYSLGKEAILTGDLNKAIGYLKGMDSRSPLWPFGLHLKATALALSNQNEEAIEAFQLCASKASRIVGYSGNSRIQLKNSEREADDLRSRCLAGEARTLYQMNQFDRADRVYDSISKKSLVWPDILFEQAWNSFARSEYNRSLGKLVSYKSPALSFIFNPEIDVLRAQSYLALCLYSDANDVITGFNRKYSDVGVEVKEFIERNERDLPAFFDLGKSTLGSSLYTRKGIYQLENRFVRSPYFQNLVQNERQVVSERQLIRQYDSAQTGVSHNLGEGFPGFLSEVLEWRRRTVRQLGGAFVKNSLLEYYTSLIDDLEKMSFIKLEMLRLAKDNLVNKTLSKEERTRGNVEPSRRDDQYRWSFNGEFWNDELGDYVFGLESECKG